MQNSLGRDLVEYPLVLLSVIVLSGPVIPIEKKQLLSRPRRLRLASRISVELIFALYKPECQAYGRHLKKLDKAAKDIGRAFEAL